MNTTIGIGYDPMQYINTSDPIQMTKLITYGINYIFGTSILPLIWLLIGVLITMRTENPIFLLMYINLTGFFWLTSVDVYSKYVLLFSLIMSMALLVYKIFISFQKRKYEE